MSESDTPDLENATPSGDYDSAGLEFDQGLNLHDWVTRWAEIEELFDESREEGLTAAAELLERMMSEMGQRLTDPALATTGTEEEVKDLEVIRDAADRLANEQPIDDDEADYAVQRSRALFDRLAGDGHGREAF
jgi:hypothetical protein